MSHHLGRAWASWTAGLAAAALCFMGCVAGDADDGRAVEGEWVEVDLVIDDAVQLEGVRPTGPRATDAARGATRLRYELLRGTEVVAQGEVDDPREWRSEFGPDGEADPIFMHTDGPLRLVLPNVAGELRILAGERSLGSVTLRGARRVEAASAPLLDMETDVDPPELIVDNPNAIFTLLVLPEGFTAEETAVFEERAQELIDGLAQSVEFGDHWQEFRVFRQNVRSRESGIDDPRLETDLDTAFDVTFGPEDLRRCTTIASSAARRAVSDLRDAVSADSVVILSNTREHSGCASFSGRYFVGTAFSGSAAGVTAHELAHTLIGLADEYNTPYPGVDCEPTQQSWPNVAGDLENLPWADLVNTSQIPTTGSDADTIGAYAGGRYCSQNRWRPQHTCSMRQTSVGFCAVCRRELERTITERREELAQQQAEPMEPMEPMESTEMMGACPSLRRRAGATRFATAVSLGEDAPNRDTVAVIINGGDVVIDEADPLADADDRPVATYPQGPGVGAAPLARSLGAPVLLVDRDRAPEETLTALARWAPPVVVIVGGVEAVSAEVEAQIRAIGSVSQVVRHGGDTVAEVAVAVARELPPPTSVFLISHAPRAIPDNLAGAAAAAALGAPILYVGRTRVPAVTRQFLAEHGEAIRAAYIIGGDQVVDDAILAEIPNAVRLAGPTRTGTAARVAQMLEEDHDLISSDVLVVNGYRHADGLTAASRGVTTLFATTDGVPGATVDALLERRTERVTLVGGQGVLTEEVELALCRALGG